MRPLFALFYCHERNLMESTRHSFFVFVDVSIQELWLNYIDHITTNHTAIQYFLLSTPQWWNILEQMTHNYNKYITTNNNYNRVRDIEEKMKFILNISIESPTWNEKDITLWLVVGVLTWYWVMVKLSNGAIILQAHDKNRILI